MYSRQEEKTLGKNKRGKGWWDSWGGKSESVTTLVELLTNYRHTWCEIWEMVRER